MRRTVPPSAEIEAQIDRLLGVGVGDNPRESLSELARLGARLIIQRAVEDEFDAWLGRARYERRPESQRGLRNDESGLRNGFRPRRVQTAEGELEIVVPQVREAAETFASKLFPRTPKLLRTEPLKALVIGAFVRGLSMRDVASLCEQAGLGKLSKSTASRICEQLRQRYEAFKRRSLYEVRLVALFLDATFISVRPSGPKEGVLVACPTPTATSSPTLTHTPTPAPTATPRPTQVPDRTIFSDTFEDNRNDWELSSFTKIEDGLMQIHSGDYELAAIKIPLESTPSNVAVHVDIIPNPPAGADPSTFLYGVGCRLNETVSDFYFFGVSPAPGVDGFFMATFMQFKDTKLVDHELFPIELSEAQDGDGFTATFLCSEDNFKILDGKFVAAAATNSDFREGHLFLGMYQLDGIAGSVQFDNLTVSEVH